MTFNIDFDERAFKEWKKLDKTIRDQFKKKLRKLQHNPYRGSVGISAITHAKEK